MHPLNDSLLAFQKQLWLSAKKPGMYRLPQDGMLCIVPDTKAVSAMPNAWKGSVAVPFTGNPLRIPNPAQPFRYLPKTK